MVLAMKMVDGSSVAWSCFPPRGGRKTSLCAGVTGIHLFGPGWVPGGFLHVGGGGFCTIRHGALQGTRASSSRATSRLTSRLTVTEYKSEIEFRQERVRYQRSRRTVRRSTARRRT